jgi:hypothetical protein
MMKWWTCGYLFVWCVLLAIFISYLTGCGGSMKNWLSDHKKTETPKNGCSPVQQALNPGLDKLILLGVVGAGVGLGLFFFLPETHRLSTTILGVGAGVGGLALVLRISLPALTYGVYALLGLGVLFLVYELYVKFIRKA